MVNITGVVQDENGNPVSGALVTTTNTTKNTQTGRSGRFSLSGISEGQTTIRVIRRGYQDVSEPITVTEGLNDRDLNIILPGE